MAGIEDLVDIFRGENLIDKYKRLIEIKNSMYKGSYPGQKKIGKFATTKLSDAKDYARKFPNIIKSAKIDKKTLEFGKKFFDKAHFKQMADHTGERSRLLLPKKAQDKLKVDILKTMASNAKALSPLALKGFKALASLPVAIIAMMLTPTKMGNAEATLEDFAKLNEGSTNVDKSLPSEPKDM
jgi:hypothetical protein